MSLPSDSLLRCAHCGAQLLAHPDGTGLWCQFCGATQSNPDALDAFQQRQSAAGVLSDYDPPTRDWEMPYEELNAYNEAWKSIQMGDRATAVFVLNRLLDKQPDSADAWYLMSLTKSDPSDRWECLTRALNAQPHHEYAWRDRGVLEGVIPAGDAPPAPTLQPGKAVPAQAETPACPMCGGALSYDPDAGGLRCAHCDYQPNAKSAPPPRRRTGYQPLDNALLQRRFGFSQAWDIGARVLVCPSCAALLTLGAGQFSTRCPFCDSAQVLVKDRVGSFEQPDALLPFSVDKRAAARALHERMSPEQRAQIERGEMWPVYLPFWAFEGAVFVSLPAQPGAWNNLMPGVYRLRDVLVRGVDRPGQALLYALVPYDLGALQPYDARYLARWPAQVYNVDVVQASVTARGFFKHTARLRASGVMAQAPDGDLARSDQFNTNPPDTPLWRAAQVELQDLNYRLVLLPVWMITLIQSDGTHRPAAVNGQTGEAVLVAGFDRTTTILAGPDRPPVEALPLVPAEHAPPRKNVIRPLEPLHKNVIRPIAPLPRRR